MEVGMTKRQCVFSVVKNADNVVLEASTVGIPEEMIRAIPLFQITKSKGNTTLLAPLMKLRIMHDPAFVNFLNLILPETPNKVTCRFTIKISDDTLQCRQSDLSPDQIKLFAVHKIMQERSMLIEYIQQYRLDLQDDMRTSAEPNEMSVIQLSRLDKGNTITRWSEKIRAIDAAVERFSKGLYGICCKCREEIDINRLASIGESPFCTECQIALNKR